MTQVTIERLVNLPPEKTWDKLADFADIAWAAGDNKVDIIGEGAGMIRRIHMPELDEPIDEVLESIDHDKMLLVYTIPRGLPFPVSEYRASAQVVPENDGKTRIIWQSGFTPEPGLAEADAIKLFEGVYNQLIDWLEASLSKQ